MAVDPRHFPKLLQTGYRITSNPYPAYNCIAWAVGETKAWWWPDPGNYDYWPAGITRQETVDAFTEAFVSLGFMVCGDDSLEAGWEKIALYTLNGVPTHAARQLPSGLWTSKLGPDDDLEHSLEGLTGPLYGAVIRVFRRMKPSTGS